MKKYVILFVLLGALLVATSCSRDSAVAPKQSSTDVNLTTVDPEMVAGEVMMASGWEYDPKAELPEKLELLQNKDARCHLIDIQRVVLAGDIALYSFQIRVGFGENEVIGLHRVVRERRPYRPIRTGKSVMIVHGAPGLFLPIFITGLYSPYTTPEESFPYYLASDDVDVWGIDLRWALVPADETDFSYLADWNTDEDLHDIRVAFQVARAIRLFTGNGYGKMLYAGYSLGGYLGYAYLNYETQQPACRRQVNGFVNMDYHFKTDDEFSQGAACAFAEFFYDVYEQGLYAFPDGLTGQSLSRLAISDPGGPSDMYPGFTNYQAALAYGTALPEDVSFVPGYHLVAGVFEDGVPNDLRFTAPELWFDFMEYWSPYYLSLEIAELLAVACHDDLPYDDYLDEITVPVLYVGAGGGFGEYGLYTLDLLGSQDITTHLVDVEPAFEDRLIDFGHVDIFSSPDAPTLTWGAILTWINNHSCREGGEAIQFTASTGE